MFVILLCFDTYFAMPLNKFYRYHEMMSEKQREKSRRSGINVNARPPYWTIFKQASPQLFNVFFIFFVTLTVFPAVHSDIKQLDDGKFMGIVSRDLFTPITCFLTFNVFAMLGSLTTSWVKWVSWDFIFSWPLLVCDWWLWDRHFDKFLSNICKSFNINYSPHRNTSCGQLYCALYLCRFSYSATINRWALVVYFPFTLTTMLHIGSLLWLWATVLVT